MRKPHFWMQEGAEGGFSSVGVVIALTLVVALIFSSAQVYWINSRSGDIQFAADAGALAAENVVAEYYTVARCADAVVLTMTLFGMLVMGVGIVVSCIPYCQEAGAELMEFANDVFDTRDTIAKTSSAALTELQKALPFIAIANCALTVNANSAPGSTYIGIAILVPMEFEEVDYGDETNANTHLPEIAEKNIETQREVTELQKVKDQTDEAFRRGYSADCGNCTAGFANNPASHYSGTTRCMYERSNNANGQPALSWVSEQDWSFADGLNRARQHYRNRLNTDRPFGPTIADQAQHESRLILYRYILERLSAGYCTDNGSYVNIYLPSIPRSPSEWKQTHVYTDNVFPVSTDNVLHGTTQCSKYIEAGPAGMGSLASLDQNQLHRCESCEIDINRVGRTFNATTNMETGFEHWYREFREAAEDYEKYSNEYHEKEAKTKKDVDETVNLFDEALKAIKTERVNPHPPGRKGCIVIVMAPQPLRIPGALSSPLVANTGDVPMRLAISAAALAKDTESNILADFLEGVKANTRSEAVHTGLVAPDFILDIWGGMLEMYGKGCDGLSKGVGDMLRLVTFNQSSPLAAWAEKAIENCLEAIGLQPVDLHAPKPLIINSIHVARADSSGAVSSALLGVRNVYGMVSGGGSGTIVDAIIGSLNHQADLYADMAVEDGFELFRFSLGNEFYSIDVPIVVRMPKEAANQVTTILHDCLENLRQQLNGDDYIEIWR